MQATPTEAALLAALRDFIVASGAVPQPPASGHARYVTVALAAKLTGLSAKAIRRKIEDGKWLDGREYRRAPDGGVFIDMKGYAAWVECGR